MRLSLDRLQHAKAARHAPETAALAVQHAQRFQRDQKAGTQFAVGIRCHGQHAGVHIEADVEVFRTKSGGGIVIGAHCVAHFDVQIRVDAMHACADIVGRFRRGSSAVFSAGVVHLAPVVLAELYEVLHGSGHDVWKEHDR